MARVDFRLDDVELRTNLAEFGPKVNKTITLATDFGGTKGLKEMKTKAPWTDRTTNARNGLNSKVDHHGESAIGFAQHDITFAHGMDYGIWLEVAHSGQYQIIMPTVLAVGQQVMKALQDLLGNLGGTPNVNVNVDVPNPGRQGTPHIPSQGSESQRGRTTHTARTRSPRGTRRTRRS